MKLRILLVAFAGLLTVSSCTNKEEVKTENKSNTVTDTVAKTNAAQPELTIQYYHDRVKQDPNNPNAYFERSNFVLKEAIKNETLTDDHLALAINDLERAISIDSAVAVFHYELGDIFYKLGRSDDALAEFEKTIALDPEYTDAHVKLSQIYIVFRYYGKAMESINTALKVDEFLPEGYYLKGWIYQETGDTTLAVSSYETARELNPDYYDPNMQLGLLYAEAHSELALQYYNSALLIKPESVEAIYAKGYFLQEHQRFEEAIEVYKQLLAVEPTNAAAFHNIGYVHLVYLEQYAEAIEPFTKAIENAPQYYQAYYNRGWSHELLGDKKSAESDYRAALQIYPEFDLAARGLGRLGV